jgi:hypothetical protein
MAAYDASYGTPANAHGTPANARQGLLTNLSEKVSGLLSKAAPVDPLAPADYALKPDAKGRVTLAGRKVPLALAVVGAGVVAALLINRRTRAPAIAAATTAWSFFGSKLAK